MTSQVGYKGRICHICLSPPKPHDHLTRDPLYPSLRLCGTHSVGWDKWWKSAYKQWLIESRQEVNMKRMKRISKKMSTTTEKDHI